MTKITKEMINYVFNNPDAVKTFKNPVKAQDVCKMREQGNTYEVIGKEFNISITQARHYVERTMKLYCLWHKIEEKDKEIMERIFSINSNWTEIQAINDLERLVLRGERPADKVIGMAIKALKKQVPKKIARTKDNYKLPICPICGGGVQRKPYCYDCGQRLEWSDLT